MTAAVANFYVPTLAMIYIYGRIFRTIRKRGRKDLGATGGVRKSAEADGGAPEPVDKPPLGRSTSLFARLQHAKFRWCPSAPAALENGPPVALQCFASLTLLELHGEASHYADIAVSVEYVDERAERPPMRATNSSNALAPTSRLIAQNERKAARQLGVIMCAFIVCWLPYFIVFLVVAVCPDCINGTLSKVTLWLGYINSTLNPVLYPLCNANFRHAFGRILANSTSVCHARQTYPTQPIGPARY